MSEWLTPTPPDITDTLGGILEQNFKYINTFCDR